MPEFLRTRGVTSKIESIIANSKDTLILVSPYLSYIPDNIIERIQKARARGIRVILVFRDFQNIHSNELDKLATIEGLEIFQNKDVHAKAYFNEREAVVTSFNLSGYSEQNNVEFGVYFTKKDSEEMYSELCEEVDQLISSQRTELFYLNPVSSGNEHSFGIPQGHCIRCNTIIELNTDKPFCYNCYSIWDLYENYNHPENYCHVCGNPRKTSMKEPVCPSC